MPHASIWFPTDWTKEDVKIFMDHLADIALELGYTTHGGPKAGRGNVRAMMQDIVAGKLVILPNDEKKNYDND